MMSIGEELCANTHPRSNGGRKQIGMFLAARAHGLSSHSREHQSSISVYWPQDDEFTDAHVDRTYETEINAVPGDVLRTLCELPNTAFSPDTINQAASGRINVRTVLKQVHYIEFPKLNRPL